MLNRTKDSTTAMGDSRGGLSGASFNFYLGRCWYCRARQLALMLGTHRHLVELALGKGDSRRIKSVAPAGDR